MQAYYATQYSDLVGTLVTVSPDWRGTVAYVTEGGWVGIKDLNSARIDEIQLAVLFPRLAVRGLA